MGMIFWIGVSKLLTCGLNLAHYLFLFIAFGFIIFAGCVYAKINLRSDLKVFSGLLWTQALPWTFKMIFLISANYAIAFEGC